MENIENRSLAELESLYKSKLQHWTDRRNGLIKEVESCEEQMAAYDQKLRYIRALVNGPEAAAAVPAPRVAPRPTTKKRRRRKAPIRDAVLQVLRNRPGQKLTMKQIRTAVRKDTHKRASRQAINVSCEALERAGLIRRGRAPKGAGARFIFWAV